MNFDLSKTQKMLQDASRTFFQRECLITKVRELIDSEQGHDSALWTRIAEQGWTGLTLPEEHEGLALSLVDLAVVSEEIGHCCLPSPFVATTWASSLIDSSGNTELKKTLLPSLALGESIATVALLDEDSDWNPATVTMSATPSDAGVVLSGSKRLVLDAGVADTLLVAAQINDDLVIAAVDKAASGLSMEPTPGMDLTRRYYQVDFENVSAELLASGAEAEAALKRSIQIGAIIACADLLGGMEWVLKTTVEYARSRQQFGKAIGSYQAVQHQCADMLLMNESARSATYYAAWALHENDPAGDEAVGIAKAYCSEAARLVGNSGIQIHGGIGFTWEHDLHLYYKRAKSNEYLFGDPSHHREQLAQLIIN